jgi:hypothetical protein
VENRVFNDWMFDDGIYNFAHFCCEANDFVRDSADVRQGALSNETMFAIKHTVATSIELISFY